MSRKYELYECEKTGLNRVLALRDIPRFNVKAGDIGGYVRDENNLSQYGDCWIADSASVFGFARVMDNALVYGNAKISGNVFILENAQVYENATVCGNAYVHRDARIYGDVRVYGSAKIREDAQIQKASDFLCVAGLGSRYGAMTFYRTTKGISVVCGLFYGPLDRFREKVKEIHGDNKYVREYELACQLAELHILGEAKQV